jgi:hypothetical protein
MIGADGGAAKMFGQAARGVGSVATAGMTYGLGTYVGGAAWLNVALASISMLLPYAYAVWDRELVRRERRWRYEQEYLEHELKLAEINAKTQEEGESSRRTVLRPGKHDEDGGKGQAA